MMSFVMYQKNIIASCALLCSTVVVDAEVLYSRELPQELEARYQRASSKSYFEPGVSVEEARAETTAKVWASTNSFGVGTTLKVVLSLDEKRQNRPFIRITRIGHDRIKKAASELSDAAFFIK